jgi:alpha-1,2-mannosyltransferase
MSQRTTWQALSALPRTWIIVGLTALTLGVGVQYAIKTAEPDPNHPNQPGTRSAFLRWRGQLHDLWDGKDIYKLHTYPNAPIMALILSPLAYLPKVAIVGKEIDLGALSWFALKVGMTALTFFLAVKLIQDPNRPFPPGGQLVMLFLSLRPIIGDLSHGNVNLLILFLVVLALHAYRCGRDMWSGLTLALAITCKVTPALFVPYFLIKREWKTVGWCMVGLLLFFILVPGAILGFERNWELLNGWVDNMILPFVVGGEVTTEHCNQSLPGMLYRLLTHSPSFIDGENQPVGFHNLVALDPSIVRWMLRGCGVAFLALLWWLCRRPTPTRSDWRLAIEYGIVVLGMLLFSERTWKHHCVTMLLPFGVLCYYLTVMRPTPGRSAFIIGTIVVAEFLMALTSTSLWGGDLGYPMGAKLAQVYGAYVWADLFLLAALIYVRRQFGPVVAETTSETPSKEATAAAIS